MGFVRVLIHLFCCLCDYYFKCRRNGSGGVVTMVEIQGVDGVYKIDNGVIKHYSCKRVRGFEAITGAKDVKLPTRKTKGSACYDFYLSEDVTVYPWWLQAFMKPKIIQTNVKAYMPEDEVLLLYIRSSIGLLKGVTLGNNVGVIDTDYYNNEENEGNIGLVLVNRGWLPKTFKKGERIMQGMFVKYGVVDNDSTTGERKGGTGSTGK